MADRNHHNCKVPFTTRMLQAGMNMVRLNTANQGVERTLAVLRTASANTDLPVNSGDTVCVVGDNNGECKPGSISLTWTTLSRS
jgi:hypothetical protein